LLHLLWGLPLLRVVVLMTSVVLVVELVAPLLSLVVGALLVNEVHALRLGEAVDLSTGETGEELLGKLVGDGLALVALLVLECLEPSEGGSTCDGLVRELGFVGGVVVGVVGLLVVVVGVAWVGVRRRWLRRMGVAGSEKLGRRLTESEHDCGLFEGSFFGKGDW
jgi:hypothetical protein